MTISIIMSICGNLLEHEVEEQPEDLLEQNGEDEPKGQLVSERDNRKP